MKKTFIIILLLLVLGLILWMTPNRRSFRWDPWSTPALDGTEPYDMALFDEFMSRSLDSGYEVQQLDILDATTDDINCDPENDPNFKHKRYTGYRFYKHDDDSVFPTDTSLIVVQTYPWHVIEEEMSGGSFNVLSTLFDFAERGGKAVYVFTSENTEPISRITIQSTYDTDLISLYLGEPYNGERPHTKSWLEKIEDVPFKVTTANGDTFTLSRRFAHSYFKTFVSSDYLRSNYFYENKFKVRKLLENDFNDGYGAIEFYFPKSGGSLRICSFGLYFCNLGLHLHDGPEVIKTVVDGIDDRPVKRLQYPYYQHDYKSYRTSRNELILKKIKEDKTLWLIWLLLLGLAGAVLINGLMRKYPVQKGVDIDDLDRTDAAAVRQYRFRKSPLLHFLFQCSWLFNDSTNYHELFYLNFRRLSRMVKKYTGIEFSSSSYDDLRRASESLALRCNRKANDIYNDLVWMRERELSDKTFTPADYSKSQTIVEKFPYA